MHTILKDMFVFLAKHNINYCVLRNFDKLNDELPNGDIDVLVERNKIGTLVSLISNEFTHKPYKVMRHSIISTDFFFASHDNGESRTINFEFRTSLCGYSESGLLYEYLDAKKVLKDLQLTEYKIPVLNNVDYFVHLYFETFYQNKLKYENDLNQIRLTELEKTLVSDHFIDCKFEDLLDRKSQLKINQSFSFLLAKYFFSLIRNLFYNLKPKGKLVIFLGPDGSGKTTICDSFVDKHKRSFSNLIRLDLSNRPIFLKSLFGTNTKKVITKVDSSFKHKPYSKPNTKTLFRNYFRIIYHCIDHVLHYYFVLKPIMVKGGYIFSERYFYDYLCSDKRYLPGVSIRFKELLLWFVPKPSFVFVLNMPPSQLYNRKPELSINQIKYEQSRYLNFSYGQNSHIIDNSRSINETILDIEKFIFETS